MIVIWHCVQNHVETDREIITVLWRAHRFSLWSHGQKKFISIMTASIYWRITNDFNKAIERTIHPKRVYSPSRHPRLGCFSSSDLEKCSTASLSQQWILCSEWVPSEWVSKQLIKTSQVIHTTPVHQLTSWEDKSCLVNCMILFRCYGVLVTNTFRNLNDKHWGESKKIRWSKKTPLSIDEEEQNMLVNSQIYKWWPAPTVTTIWTDWF